MGETDAGTALRAIVDQGGRVADLANGAYEAFEQLTALIKNSRAGAHLETSYITHCLFTALDVALFYQR